MSESLEKKYQTSPLFGSNAPYVEEFYEDFLDDPQSVPDEWCEYFRSLTGTAVDRAHGPIIAQFAARATAGNLPAAATGTADSKQGRVSRLIQVYSLRGHLIANLDPLGLLKRDVPQVLTLDYFGLSDADLETEFSADGLAGKTGPMKLREIIALAREIYCGKIGAEFAHISKSAERLWLQKSFEAAMTGAGLSTEEKKTTLWQLIAAEGIERYLHTRYVGQKRFSLEGGESMIPLLDDLIQQGGANGVQEFIIGMAHRGRLNVLINVLGKSPADLFSEFEGTYDLDQIKGSGDVKYHMGFSSDVRTPGGNVHIALAFNPSHLEIVNPVVEGSVRARQERRGDNTHDQVVPVLIHGDAAFAGQGVVMETLQLSQARGFSTGGTIHVICNNQIGFTISDPRDSRSTPYCSDVAKMIEAPILHVNGDDPDAVLLVTRLALGYRKEFGKDVVIDLVCYRRHGHNEADEPAVTQPVMYHAIRKHPTTLELYTRNLIENDVVTQAEADEMAEGYRQRVEEGRPLPEAVLGLIGNEYTVDWSRFIDNDWSAQVDTAITKTKASELGKALVSLPDGFEPHPRVARVLENRQRMLDGEMPMDWGFAESMAYAALLDEGFEIRLTGQDSGRGTFFHRHAVLHNQADNETFIPLQHGSADQPRFVVTDSLLSEEAVMGFEYGYATTEPNALVIWEGQFGDFANGAQVVIDQFISSGEAKWGRLCGLTLFLPHGYEGQGPEHSSARLERYLQMCAENNMQVCVPSTPAQMFHMLCRQMLQPLRKPLIVMTPKSLLRHKLSVSGFDELSTSGFQRIIPELDILDPKQVDRVVFCSGKVYFDLLESRRQNEQVNVALIRLEQIYPFPVDEYAAAISAYPKATDVVWCQEEPRNQGAWYQIRHRLIEPLSEKQRLGYAGRDDAAAPAGGIYAIHAIQQQRLIGEALGTETASENKKPVRKKA